MLCRLGLLYLEDSHDDHDDQKIVVTITLGAIQQKRIMPSVEKFRATKRGTWGYITPGLQGPRGLITPNDSSLCYQSNDMTQLNEAINIELKKLGS